MCGVVTNGVHTEHLCTFYKKLETASFQNISDALLLFNSFDTFNVKMCPRLLEHPVFLRTQAHWPALASQSEALNLKLPFLLSDNIFYKTLHAHVNIMITNFLFLPVAVLLFTFRPLKPRTSKHPNQIYANKRNSFMV